MGIDLFIDKFPQRIESEWMYFLTSKSNLIYLNVFQRIQSEWMYFLTFHRSEIIGIILSFNLIDKVINVIN